MDRRGIAPDPESVEQEGQAGAGLAAAEVQGIRPESVGQQAIRSEVAVGGTVPVHLRELGEPRARLAASHHTPPAQRVVARRPDAGITQSLLRRGDGKPVGAVGELEELAILDRVARVKPFHLGGDAHRKAAGVETGDRRHPAAARQEGVPGGGGVVPKRGDQAQPGDGDPAPLPCHAGTRASISTRPVATRFPSTTAVRLSSAVPSVADRIAASISTA